MSRLWECKKAVSPVIATVLLVGITVIIVSILALSAFAFGTFEHEIAPMAVIVAVEAEGDIGATQLYKNKIVIEHKGGSMLFENDTEIVITGKGYMYNTGEDPYLPTAQDMRVVYRDLSGKNYGGANGTILGEIVEGTTWDAGEKIELYGKDGRNIGQIVDGQGNNVDSKWKLQAGSIASVTVIHRPTNQIIAISRITVQQP